ncbi:MAG: hypothetical protein IJ681_01720 [Bacteroidales bacterium]|nr:hypothetical protein [Bacteroidales bacterium]
MNKVIKYLLLAVFALINCNISFSQSLSDLQKTELKKTFDKHIKTISAISADRIDMISVYSYQIEKASQFIEENERYASDKEIYTKLIELKSLIKQNKEVVDFLTPRASTLFYTKAVSLLSDGKKLEAYDYLQKAVKIKPDNIMAQYELSKMSLDSGQITKATDNLTNIITTMNPTAEEKKLCESLMAYAYDKNLLQSLSLIKQGKYAYAYDILSELDAWCKKDNSGICRGDIVKKNIEICQKGIYDNHIDITKKAISKGELKVAGDFVKNTYDYIQRNREALDVNSSFEQIVQTVVGGYLKQAKSIPEARNNEVRLDILTKAKELSAMLGGEYEANVLKEIALLQGTSQISDPKLDSIEKNAKNEGYSIDYEQYVQDTLSSPEQEVLKIEKEYIASNDNKLPEQSVAVAATKTKAIDKQVDEKFFETRQFMQVNNYEKALEVLEKANRLAKMEGDKKAVAEMYTKAIREITAKRMSKAEFFIFQGDTKQADSLVALTDDLIEAYNMKEDTVIVRIMNSYLRAIDNKVCQKKQEEINVLVYDIIAYIQKNDFYTAEAYINKAMQIKGNNECRLDKTKIRALKRQIEEPLEYVKKKEEVDKLLDTGDTVKYFLEYAKLELFYNKNKLGEMSVYHTPLRTILSQTGNDKLAVKIADNLVKYKQYEGAVEALGALKELGYKAKHTKKAQKRIGKLMAFESMKRQEKIEQSYRIADKYNNDKWFKYFLKTYKKNVIKFNKAGRDIRYY